MLSRLAVPGGLHFDAVPSHLICYFFLLSFLFSFCCDRDFLINFYRSDDSLEFLEISYRIVVAVAAPTYYSQVTRSRNEPAV